MKRTLLVTAFYPPKVGGVEHYLAAFSRLCPPGRLVILAPPDPDAAQWDAQQPVKIIRQPLFSLRSIRPSWMPLLWTLPRLIRRERIEQIVFGHYAPYAITGWFLRRRGGTRYHVMFHGVDALFPRDRAVATLAFRVTTRGAASCIANSRFIAKRIEALGAPVDRTHIVYPSLWRTDPPDDQRLRRDPRFAKAFLLLTVCRLVPRKGIDTVLAALPSIVRQRPTTHYFIVGDGPDRSRLEQLATTLGVAGSVTFVGNIPDTEESKAPYFSACDVFVMPTHSLEGGRDVESFGIVYLEAMAYGKPVVASWNGGAREIIEDGVHGYLVGEHQPEELAKRLLYLASEPSLAQRLGQAGKKRVQTQFLWKQQWPRLQAILA